MFVFRYWVGDGGGIVIDLVSVFYIVIVSVLVFGFGFRDVCLYIFDFRKYFSFFFCSGYCMVLFNGDLLFFLVVILYIGIIIYFVLFYINVWRFKFKVMYEDKCF